MQPQVPQAEQSKGVGAERHPVGRWPGEQQPLHPGGGRASAPRTYCRRSQKVRSWGRALEAGRKGKDSIVLHRAACLQSALCVPELGRNDRGAARSINYYYKNSGGLCSARVLNTSDEHGEHGGRRNS